MQHSNLVLLSCALMLGCSRGTIELGGDDDASTQDGGSSGSGGDDGGGESEGDGGGESEGDDGGGDGGGSDGGGSDGGGDGGGSVDWSGVYTGDLLITVLSEWGDYDLGDCATTVTVDPAGVMAGAASCDTGGWGGDTYEVPLDGNVDDDGSVTGTAPLDLGWSGSADLDLIGEIDDDGTMFLEVHGEIASDWSSAEIVGDGALERQ